MCLLVLIIALHEPTEHLAINIDRGPVDPLSSLSVVDTPCVPPHALASHLCYKSCTALHCLLPCVHSYTCRAMARPRAPTFGSKKHTGSKSGPVGGKIKASKLSGSKPHSGGGKTDASKPGGSTAISGSKTHCSVSGIPPSKGMKRQ